MQPTYSLSYRVFFLTKYFLLENTNLQNSEVFSVACQVRWIFHQKKALQDQKWNL